MPPVFGRSLFEPQQQLRYLVRLYVKELILKNFSGAPGEQLLERMVELSLYAEEKLKAG